MLSTIKNDNNNVKASIWLAEAIFYRENLSWVTSVVTPFGADVLST